MMCLTSCREHNISLALMLPLAFIRTSCSQTDQRQPSEIHLATTSSGFAIWPHQFTSHIPSCHEQGVLHLRTTGTHKLIPTRVGPCKDLARMGGYYGNEHNTEETSANVANSLDCVQNYWLTLPPDQRLAAAAVLLPMPQ